MTPVNCPNCHAAVAPADNFCEECGAKIPAAAESPDPAVAPVAPADGAPGCPNCGARPEAVDAQGFCLQCGLQRRPPPRDHVEFDAGPTVAGVSDRGVKHFHNEDAFAIGQHGGYTAAVLCDGVSNSPRADEASAAAALAIRDALIASVRGGTAESPDAMESALFDAHAVVRALAGRHVTAANAATDMPATTAIAALVRTVPAFAPAALAAAPDLDAPGTAASAVAETTAPATGTGLPAGESNAKPDANSDAPAASSLRETTAASAPREVVLGWLGDSRAYFLDRRGGARLLTRDHSWLNEVVDAKQMPYAEALLSRHAHSVTRTLGGTLDEDGRPDHPSTIRVPLPEPGWLILCTDGLWNYASEPPELAAWVQRLVPTGADALTLCRALTAEAISQGGRDNVTVVAVAV